MRRILSALVIVLGLAVAPLAAHAAPVTYDLTLTNLIGNVSGGVGTLTIDSAPTGLTHNYFEVGSAGHDITNLSFTIGGDTFTLADSNGDAEANFLLGSLINLSYLGSLGNNSVTIALATGGLGYTYVDLGWTRDLRRHHHCITQHSRDARAFDPVAAQHRSDWFRCIRCTQVRSLAPDPDNELR